MSALNAYLSEVRRQRELLEEAHERDGLAEEFCIDGAPPGIRRRIWTRQDRNRVFFKPRFLPSLVAQQQLPNYRASTRLERIVSRLRRRGIDGWHREAMAEAQSNGTYAVVAERLAAVSAIHQMLVNAYDEHLPEDWNGDWAGLQERHQRAVDELAMFATLGNETAVPATKFECSRRRENLTVERNQFIYERAMNGTGWSQIGAAVRKKWGDDLTPNGVRNIALRYADRNELPRPPKRNRGRPKNTK